MNRTTKSWQRLVAFAVMVPTASLFAQTTDEDDVDALVDDDEIIVLSPFEVGATEENDGYLADSTLGGTRIRTDLRDLATPLSVVTSQFLKDTNATNNETLLQYTTNTEVGGLVGNYGGFGNSQGINESSALLQPNQNTRVRGLEQADSTRNFFLSDIPWDSYNTDRVEIQRGPNSILFGVGSPAGIINNTTKVAQLGRDSGEAQFQVAKYGSLRASFDYNKVIVQDTLGIRIAGLTNQQKFAQNPAFRDDDRFFATATYQPQLLPESWAGRTIIRGSFETGDVTSNNPRVLPPMDAISMWFDDRAGDGVNDPIGLGKELVDPFLIASGSHGQASRGLGGEVLNGYIIPGLASIDSGALNNGGVGMFYLNGSSSPIFSSREAPRVFPGGLGPDGTIDGTIGGVPFGSNQRVASWNAYTVNMEYWDNFTGATQRFPLANRGYYKDRTLSDSSIFNFYDNLIDGDNKREYNEWDAYNLSLAQTFFDDRFGLEFVYDRQEFAMGRTGLAMNSPYISVDINKNLQSSISRYERVTDPNGVFPEGVMDMDSYYVPGFTPTAAQPYANPNVGRAIVSSGGTNNFRRENDRETSRVTAFAELDFGDFLNEDGFLAKTLGRHVFTGLYTDDSFESTGIDYKFVSMTYDWANELSLQGELTDLNEAPRNITPIFYLSESLLDPKYTTASGLNLDRIRTTFSPSGIHSINRFVSNWTGAANGDPAAPYVNRTGDLVNLETQSENPANYHGYNLGDTRILNAEAGDFDDLVTSYNIDLREIESYGITWQGYLADGHIVPTWGYREDELTAFNGVGEKTRGVAAQTADVQQFGDVVKGDTSSWGVVAHVPSRWLGDGRLLSGLSGYYNYGENNKVETRYNYDGQALPNPSAESIDYGVVIRALDDRLTIKVGRYETEVKNGNLPGGASLIGANQYYINQLEAWGTATALSIIYGNAGVSPGNEWFWNHAQHYDQDIEYLISPFDPVYVNHPRTIEQNAAADDFIRGMDQQFFDNYLIPVNVTALQSAYDAYLASGDINDLLAETSSYFPIGSYTTSIGSLGNSQINGITPNGTIDNTSEGYEIEVNYRPRSNWDIQVNASKTTAYREDLGAPMKEFINAQYERFQGPAGDLRIWWAGERTIQEFYEQNIISALRFQEESIGFDVPELRPWRFSVISNYRFEEGRLKGFSVGGSYRWMDKQILGYGLKDDLSGLSVENPIYGSAEGYLDLWFGYERQLTEKVRWRIQANLRNVGDNHHLVPISVNPDGIVAASRIQEGNAWAITNTFSF